MTLALRLTRPEPHVGSIALFESHQRYAAWQTVAWERLLTLVRSSKQIIVFIPSREVLLTQTTLNTRSRQQLQQALPFAVEEALIPDPETQHYVWHTLDREKGVLQVAIMAQERLQTWVKFLHQHAIIPQAVLPDVFTLPYTEGYDTVWLQEEGLWIRQALLQGYYHPASSWDWHVQHWQMLATPAQPIRLRLYSPEQSLAISEQFNIMPEPEEQTQTLAQEAWQPALVLNLLKGFRTQAHSQLTELWRQWQGVVWVGWVTALVALSIEIIDIQQLDKQTAALQAANTEAFRRLFPQITPDPALSLSSLLQSELKKRQQSQQTITQPASVLPLLSSVATVLPQHPLTLQRLDWQQNKLTLRFSIESSAAISALEKTLSATLGHDVSINYRRESNQLIGELILNAESAL